MFLKISYEADLTDLLPYLKPPKFSESLNLETCFLFTDLFIDSFSACSYNKQ